MRAPHLAVMLATLVLTTAWAAPAGGQTEAPASPPPAEAPGALIAVTAEEAAASAAAPPPAETPPAAAPPATPPAATPSTKPTEATPAAAAKPDPVRGSGRITICHATSSATNPYVTIAVALEGLNGHGDHPGDLIPAPGGGCPSGSTPDCAKARLPCDSIPELPARVWGFVAMAVGAATGWMATRRRRGWE